MSLADALEDLFYLVELCLNIEAHVQFGASILDHKDFARRGVAFADVFVDAVEKDLLHVGLELSLSHVKIVAVEGGKVLAGICAV